MKTFRALFSALCAFHIACAANSFPGSNLYYAAGLSSPQRTTLLAYVPTYSSFSPSQICTCATMIGLGQQFIEQHQDWQCDCATAIKNELGAVSGILVTTGGEFSTAESVQDGWLNCSALGVAAIHAYNADEYAIAALQPYAKHAQAAGKKLLVKERGPRSMYSYAGMAVTNPRGSPGRNEHLIRLVSPTAEVWFKAHL